jgi:RNA polymerase sigma-70 factor, ECF subfamily
VGLKIVNINRLSTSEQHIITGCIHKEASSMEQLYHQLYPEMIKICLRYAQNMDDAGSLYNDAMLKVFNKIEQFKNEGSFNGWVKRIVINTCIDFCRKTNKYQTQSIDDVKTDIHYVEAAAYSNMEVKEIMQLVLELPKNTGAVFNLFAIDGYKHAEIGTLLGITEGTSKWHLNEARRLLKIKLDNLLNKKFYADAS